MNSTCISLLLWIVGGSSGYIIDGTLILSLIGMDCFTVFYHSTILSIVILVNSIVFSIDVVSGICLVADFV